MYTDVHYIILTVIALLVIAILAGSIYSLFAAIFYFIFAGNNNDRRTAGQNSIKYMVIGLLLTAFLLFVVPFLFRYMGIPGSELFSFGTVMSRVRELLTYFLYLGGIRQQELQTPIIEQSGGGLYQGGYEL